MKFVNCTPHAITVEVSTEVCSCGEEGCCLGCGGEGSVRTVPSLRAIPPSGNVARVSVEMESAGREVFGDSPVGGIPSVTIYRPIYSAVTGLPPEEPGVGLIVSAMVASALAECGDGRRDIYCPDTGPTAIRENGQVVAVRALLYRGV